MRISLELVGVRRGKRQSRAEHSYCPTRLTGENHPSFRERKARAVETWCVTTQLGTVEVSGEVPVIPGEEDPALNYTVQSCKKERSKYRLMSFLDF